MNISDLKKELENLVSHLTNENYQAQFKAGFDMISEFKNAGGNRKELYDKLLPLFNETQEIDELKADLIGDWLDCICGWVGNKDWDIWNVNIYS